MEVIKTKIISLFKDFERKQKFNIIKNNFDPLVSLDFIKSDYSVNIDHRWTMVNKDLIKLVLQNLKKRENMIH